MIPEPHSLIRHTKDPTPPRPETRRRRHPNFTEETCRQSASRFEFLGDWYKAENTAYQFAVRNGHLERIKRDYFPVRKCDAWTLEECINDARAFKNLESWRNHSSKGHRVASLNGWVNIVSSEVWGDRRWTEQKVRANAARCSNLHEWIKTEQAAYMQARRKGWLESIKHDLFSNLPSRRSMPVVSSALVVAEVDQATS